MRLEDAVFYWLQMSIVAQARPDDAAAQETFGFFQQIVSEDHQIAELSVTSNEDTVFVVIVKDEMTREFTFPREAAEQLLRDIEGNPKYNKCT